MKRKWKWFVVVLVLVISGTFSLWIISSKNIPVEIIGTEISESDVPAILAAAKRGARKRILPKISWADIKNIPAKMKQNLGTKLYSIVPGHLMFTGYTVAPGGNPLQSSGALTLRSMTSGPPFVVVLAWQNTNFLSASSALSDSGIPRRTMGYSDMKVFRSMAETNAVGFIFSASSNGWEVPADVMVYIPYFDELDGN